MYLHARHIMPLSRFPLLASEPLFSVLLAHPPPPALSLPYILPGGLLHKCFYKRVVRNAAIARPTLQSSKGHFVERIFSTS